MQSQYTHPQLAQTIQKNNLTELQLQQERQRGLNIDAEVLNPA